MSTTDPTGEGGGGGETGIMSTNVEQNASPITPVAGGTAVPPSSQQQHPPPSPLSGCYLLVVLPEPHTAQHKDLILNRLAKGFLSWDKDGCHVDLEKELQALVAQAPEGEEARNGERLIQYATENLVTEVLIHPQTNTLLQCIRNLLASFTKHRHIIHAGYTFGGNGSWILQDGTFSLADFLDAFSEHEVQRVLRAYENSVTVDIYCAGVGDWTTSRLSKETCTRSCRVRVNPDDVLTAGVPAITSFTNYVGQYLVAQALDQLMEPSDVVGNIRFSHPTLYVFPGGQGDAALFGINGFNMLVDGGFARKACFWDFTRHLDRLDAVLVTRVNNSNIGGMSSVLRKKKEMHVYPQIGHFFCNLVERRQSNSPDGDKDIDPLILNLTDIGQEMVINLRHINLRAHPCYRDPDPINLYHKVGHGTLDMYVLSPSKDSREVREFLAKWHASDSKLFAGSHKKDSNNLMFPIQNLVSICALLVWQPANPEDTITRILFPGSTPQHKIFEGFERLKHLDFLKHPICSAKSLSPSTSLATLRDKPAKQKLSLIEKDSKKVSEVKKEKRESGEMKVVKGSEDIAPKSTPQSTPIIPTKAQSGKVDMKTKKVAENKKIESEVKDIKESKKIEKEMKEVKKEPKKEPAKQLEKVDKVEKVEKREEDSTKKTEIVKSESEKPKESKPKHEAKKKESKEVKAAVKAAKIDTSAKPKPIERKVKPTAEKKDVVKSSPTTPKKTLNGAATKIEMTKAVPKVKPAAKTPTTLPAKSAKDANNRKVLEQKNIEKSSIKESSAAAKASAKPKPIDRKPISRRTKPVSPSKVRLPGSPAKSTRSTPTTSVKSDKDGVTRKVKGDRGTADSSTVSTPSGIEPETAGKIADKSLTEKSEDISLDSIESKVLADLKEEREVVEEIEAVLQKAERIEETGKDDRFEGDDEITAEVTDKKEEDITEEDVTAEIEDAPKKDSSRKESQELTEEDEYLIVEKEEVYTEDSVQSGEGEQKHVIDEAESEKAKVLKDTEFKKEKGEKEEAEEKEKDESPDKQGQAAFEESEIKEKPSEIASTDDHKEELQEEEKEIIAGLADIAQKTEEKEDSGKKDSEDVTKEPSSFSPDKLDSSEKKTTDTDMKPEADQKEQVPEKLEESQERISTLESGATTTAPTLPEDERIPLDEIKEDIDEKHVVEEVKEKDVPKVKEEVVAAPETAAAVPPPVKPDGKVFDVHQTVPCLQRDIVKTPDEVADLPVHEEVDPKLYRMDDFEKDKEEKSVQPAQDAKEPPTPPVKEQKSVFSFFGKVADKFEKGIDKLTKKSKKDQEKDVDEKSSKSSSPKEPKVQEKTLLQEVDMDKMFPKVVKPSEKAPEEAESSTDVKPASPKEEIAEAKTPAVKDESEEKEKPVAEETGKDVQKPVSPLAQQVEEKKEHVEEKKEDVKGAKPLQEEDDAKEVEALLEEASKKFKTVKDSLRDSLESLEGKIDEEIQQKLSPAKDVVKDTLEGVAEKLEEIKPHIESALPADAKPAEKVKFDIPKDEEFEEEYVEELEGPVRDVKEAVRDVGEVLAGTAGIVIDDKPKDVIEIVKKVAEVLKEDDDFLSDKVLFPETAKKDAAKPSVPDKSPKYGDIVIPTKVGITEEFPPQEEIEELIEATTKPLPVYETPSALEVHEEPCKKIVKDKEDITSPVVEKREKEEKDAKEICEEIMKDDHICKAKETVPEELGKMDVMAAGIESVCVKKIAKTPSDERSELAHPAEEIEEPVICFEQKVVPAKAEIVIVSPGSTPTSPKFTTDKMYDNELVKDDATGPELPAEIKTLLDKEGRVEEIIEELVITKTKKITIEIIEYITIVKHIPRERVIYIIDEIIIRHGLRRESVVDNVEILKSKEPITPQVRMELEEYIINEYVTKGKRITIQIIEEISIKKIVPKKIVIEIIEEIIIKRKISRHLVLDVTEEELSEEQPASEVEEAEVKQDALAEKRKSVAEPGYPEEKDKSPAELKDEEVTEPGAPEEEDTEEDKLVDGFVSIDSTKLSKEAAQLKDDKLTTAREHEKDASDDFEAVEQEYKVRDVPVTSPDRISRDVSEKMDETKERDDAEEAVEDTISEVVEAEEKFLHEAKEKTEKEKPIDVAKDAKTSPQKEVKEEVTVEADKSEVSEVVDTTEKYLDEAKEKVDVKHDAKSPVSIPEEKEDATKPGVTTPQEKEEKEEEVKDAPDVGLKDEKVMDASKPAEKVEKEEPKEAEDKSKPEETIAKAEEADSKPIPETKLADATGRAAEPKPELIPDIETSNEKEDATGKDRSPEEPADGVPSRKASIQQESKPSAQVKVDDKREPEEPADAVPSRKASVQESKPYVLVKVDDKREPEETSFKVDEDGGIVKRMLVTASSEDGGHETEICPSGTITFTKTVTPDDSLKDSVKSTPDKDSLLLEIDSLHSERSTPEKDSISDKSAAEAKDVGKVTPEDSLDKSSVDTRGSQDLDDSLEKTETGKRKESVSPSELSKSPVKIEAEKDEKTKSPVKSPAEMPLRKPESPEKPSEEEKEKPKSPMEKMDEEKPKSPEEKLSIGIEKGDSVLDIGGPKSPESIRSDDVSPTETIFAKSPTESQLFSKIPSEKKDAVEDIFTAIEKEKIAGAPSAVDDKKVVEKQKDKDVKEPVDELSAHEMKTDAKPASPVKIDDKAEDKGLSDKSAKKSRTSSISSDKSDEKEQSDRAKSPSIAGDKVEETKLGDFEDKIKDKSRSPSITSEKRASIAEKLAGDRAAEEEAVSKSRSASIASQEPSAIIGAEQEDKEPMDKSRSPSIVGDRASVAELEVKSKSPSVTDEKPLEEELEEILSRKSRSSSIVSEKKDGKTPLDKAKSPSEISEKSDDAKPTGKSRSSSIVSDKPEEKVMDTPKRLSVADVKEAEKSRSGSVVTEHLGDKTPAVTSPAATSDKSDDKKSPGVIEEKPDVKDDFEQAKQEDAMDRSKSPVAIGQVERDTDKEKSPSVETKSPVEKDEKPADKGRSSIVELESLKEKDRPTEAPGIAKSPSVASDKSGQSKSPSVTDEKPDLAEVEEAVSKSRSASVASVTTDQKVPSKPSSIGDDAADLKDLAEELKAKSRSTSIVSVSSEHKEAAVADKEGDRSKSPSVTSEAADLKDVKESVDKSRSSSIASVVSEQKDIADKAGSVAVDGSRSPSTAGDKADLKDVTEEAIEKLRSLSVISIPGDFKELSGDRSKSPSIAGEKGDLQEVTEKAADKSRSASIVSTAGEMKDQTIDRSKSPSIASEKADLQEVSEKAADKSRSASIASTASEMKDQAADRSKSPSIAGEKADLQEVSEKAADKSRSASIVSTASEMKDQAADRSKSPSIAGEKADLQEVSEKVADKLRSASIVSTASEIKEPLDKLETSTAPDKTDEPIDRSKSPSVASEKFDDKKSPVGHSPVSSAEAEERSRSPSIAGDKTEEKVSSDKSKRLSEAESLKDAMEAVMKSSVTSPEHVDSGDRSKSSSIAAEKPDLKDVSEEPADRSRSTSIISVPEDSKAATHESKSPSLTGDKPDLKDVADHDKSKSPSIAGDKPDLKDVADHDKSKSPSIAGDKPDLKDVADHDKSKSPSIAGDKPDLKDVADHDKSKSPSIAGDKPDLKDVADHDKSKSPSIAGDKPDLKDVADHDKSKSSSIAGDKPDLKDVADHDKSKSPSIAGDKPDLKDVADHDKSKSPSIAGDKPDLKDVADHDKSKSPSIAGDKPDLKDVADHDKSKSPSIAGDKPDLKDVADHDKSKSSSIAGDKPDLKDVADHDKSKSPSIAGDKPDLKDVADHDKSKSPSIAGDKPDLKDVADHDKSKSPSIAGDKPDLKDVADHDKSKSPSIAGDKPDLKDVADHDKSKSPSIAGDKPDLKDVADHDKSKSPSIAGDKPDLKDVADHDKSKSPSIAGDKPDLKDVADHDKSKSPSIAGDKPDLKDVADHDKSKSPSIAGDKPDLKDVADHDKSKSPSVIGDKPDFKDVDDHDKSKLPSVAGDKPDLKDVADHDKSKSSSVAGDKPDLKDVAEHDKSKSPSVAGDKPDLKDVTEQPLDKSRSPSVSIPGESADRSKSPSIVGEHPDLKEVSEQPSGKSRSSSVISTASEPLDKLMSSTVSSERKSPSPSGVTEEKLDTKDVMETPTDKSRSPSVASIKEKSISPLKEELLFDKRGEKEEYLDALDKSRSPSIIDDKATSPSKESKTADADEERDRARSRTPSLVTEKPRTLSIASDKAKDLPAKGFSEKQDDDKLKHSPQDLKGESEGSKSPIGGPSRDRSRSHSLYETGEKTPLGRSRAASVYDDKLSEQIQVLHEEVGSAFKHVEEKRSADEQEKFDASPRRESKDVHIAVTKTILDEDLGATGSARPVKKEEIKVDKSEDEDDKETDEIVKVTAEKRAHIEKHIVDEYVTRKRKISMATIEKMVMTYSVPQFVVTDIIEDIIAKSKVRRDSIVDYVEEDDQKSPDETEIESLDPIKKADLEKYVEEEFIAKKKKISSKVLDEISTSKTVTRYLLITIIEEILTRRNIPRNSLIDDDVEDFDKRKGETSQADAKEVSSLLQSSEKTKTTDAKPDYLESPQDVRGSRGRRSTDGKVSPVDQEDEEDSRDMRGSQSASPEPIASDKSTQDSPVRSEPHIDEEISISEEKRTEIEKLLEEEYIKKGKKITEVILEEIIIRTSLPRYIILEIVEEIILKKKLSRDTVIDTEIYHEDEPDESYEYRFEKSPEPDYEMHGEGRKLSYDYKTTGYAETERHMGKSISDYPVDYESQFHKAFVGGMTEIRTTHITTLSGKSTPDLATRDGTPESVSEPTASTVERADDKSASKLADRISPEKATLSSIASKTSVSPTDPPKTTQIVTVLKDSKIGEPEISPEPAIKSKEVAAKKETEQILGDKVTVVRSEVIDQTVPEATKQPADEPEVVTKIIKREIIEQTEPEILTTVVKREIIEQTEPEIITKVVKREIILPDFESGDVKEETIAGHQEVVETVTTLSEDQKSSSEVSKTADVKRIVTTVTTTTGPDGKVTTQTDVKESTDTVDSEDLLEKLIDSSYGEKQESKATEAKTGDASKLIKETITSTTSGSADVKAFYDSHQSSPSDLKEEESGDKVGSLSGKSSPEPSDIGSARKSPEVPASPFPREGATAQLSGRSTPDRRSEGRSLTGTPEGFRSGEVIRTIITTTKSVSDEGEIITTTSEVTESTNEKGETVVLAEKTDVKIDERLPNKEAAETAISSIIGSIKSSELHGASPGFDQKDQRVSAKSDDKETYSDYGSASQSGSHFGKSLEKADEQVKDAAKKVEKSVIEKDEADKEIEEAYSMAAMSSSFCGELPTVPPMHKISDPIPIQGDFTFKRTVEKEYDFEKALTEMHMEMTQDVGTEGSVGSFSSDLSSRYSTDGRLQQEMSDDSKDETKDAEKSDAKKDPLAGWGTPLGLPSPTPPRKFNLKTPAQSISADEVSSDTLDFDVTSDWGEPLRLPSPAPVNNEISNKGAPGTPKKEKKQAKKVMSENLKNKKRSESPGKNEKKMKDSKNKVQPVYVDLTYVPHHGNSYYTSLEFFKRVRARYYVFSGTEPSRDVYDALLEAKKTWEDKDLEVTMIPTYDTDTLGYWVADNEEALATNHIDLSPSASRCTINLQDHETSCSAYRLEF